MQICSYKHKEVCHDSSTCPMCELIEKNDEKLEDVSTEIDDLENEIVQLEKELREVTR